MCAALLITYNKPRQEKLYAQGLCTVAVIQLAARHASSGRKKTTVAKGRLSALQLKQLLDYIRSTLYSPVTLSALANCVHLSMFHFARLFKHTMGIGPYQFVLQMKIEQGKLLLESNTRVGVIAHLLCFTDQAHFCNAFRKHTGVSPLRYAQQYHSAVSHMA